MQSNGFIELSKSETKQAQEDLLKIVENHHIMMDDFSFMYQEEDIVHALSMKCWPAQIQETINDGRDKIGSVTEEMVLKLEQDKEEFGRNMQSYKDTFKKIQTFNSVD